MLEADGEKWGLFVKRYMFCGLRLMRESLTP